MGHLNWGDDTKTWRSISPSRFRNNKKKRGKEQVEYIVTHIFN